MIGGRALVVANDAVHTTLGVVLQSGIDLDRTYGPNEIQIGFSIFFGLAVIVFSALFMRYLSSLILDDEEAEHARAVTSGLRFRTANTLRIPHDADLAEYRSRIRALFDDDFEPGVKRLPDAVREVRGEWKRRRRAATEVVRGELPALSRALSLDGVLYLVLGALVVEPLTKWGELVSTTGDPPSPSAFVDGIVSAVTFTIDVVASFPFAGMIYQFAFIGAMTAGRWLYGNVYVVGFTLILGAIAIWYGDRIVADDVDPRLYRSRPRAAFAYVGTIAAAWFAGVSVSIATAGVHSTIGRIATTALVAVVVGFVTYRKWLGVASSTSESLEAYRRARREFERIETAASAAKTLAKRIEGSTVDDESTPWYTLELRARSGPPYPVVAVAKAFGASLGLLGVTALATWSAWVLDAATFGSTAGLLASLAAAWFVGRRELRGAKKRLVRAYRQADDDGVGPTGTTTYIVARKVFGALGTLAALVLPIYVLNGVTTGRFRTVAEIAIFESSTQVRVLVAAFLLAFIVFAVVQTRPAWGDFAGALRWSLERKGLRLALLTRGFPLLAFLLTFVVAWGTPFFGTVTALAAGVAVAFTLKAFFFLKTQAEHAYAEAEFDLPKPGRVFAEAVVVEDADGNEIAVVDLNGVRIAAPIGMLDALVDQIVDDVDSIFETRRANPSVFRYYGERIDDGRVSFPDVEREYMGSIAKEIERRAREAGRDGVAVERLDEDMAEKYDTERYLEKRQELRKKDGGITIYAGRVKKT